MHATIAIISCAKHTLEGYNESIRQTWLNEEESTKFGLNCKFFIGTGNKECNQDFDKVFERDGKYGTKKCEDPSLGGYNRRSDEIYLECSDKYTHASYKIKEICSRCTDEYLFLCQTDTYVVLSRLNKNLYDHESNDHQYWGTSNYERTAIGGGPGIWLRKDAYGLIASSPVTNWLYDGWIGDVMQRHNVALHHDEKYTNLDAGDEPPLSTNSVITSHIANYPTVYHPRIMHKLHQDFIGER
jgi:hypothetical protein